jgi:hypothetical protein
MMVVRHPEVYHATTHHFRRCADTGLPVARRLPRT